MYKTVWKFKIKSENQNRFEEIYGKDGQWAKLFRQAEGYLGTEFFHDLADNLSYITIDTWRSEKDFKVFKSRWQTEYQTLDQQCENLTEAETRIGSFEVI